MIRDINLGSHPAMRFAFFIIIALLSGCARPEGATDALSGALLSGRWLILETDDPEIPVGGSASAVAFDFSKSEIQLKLGTGVYAVKFIWNLSQDVDGNDILHVSVYGSANAKAPTRAADYNILANKNGVMVLEDPDKGYTYKVMLNNSQQ